jgi:hypothetical protein
VAKADVVLAQDLQSAWGNYAAAECGAVILNARERATIGADYKKEVAGAELAAVKAVAPARKTSMIAAAEANGVYHVKVTGIIADLGILGGQIHVEQVKASQSLISPATLKNWLDSLSTWGDMAAAAAKGLAQGVANSLNGVQDNFAHTGNLAISYVNSVADVTDAFVGTPEDQRIRIPMIPLVDWSRGRFTVESDFDHSTSKTAGGFGFGVLGPMGYAKLAALRNVAVVDDYAGAAMKLRAQATGGTLVRFDPVVAGQNSLTSGRMHIDALRRLVPHGTPNVFKPSPTIAAGSKYQYTVNGVKLEIKWHAPDAMAASKFPGSTSGRVWTAQIKIGNKLLGIDGRLYLKPQDITHIPVDF